MANSFNLTGNFPNQPVRRAPSKYDQEQLTGYLEVGDHRASTVDVFYPYKYLPIRRLDVSSQDGIVLLKGTIIAVTHASDSLYLPDPSEEIPVFQNALTSATVTVPMDDTYFGYERGVKATIVPANGGNAATYTYRTADTTRTFKNKTSLANAGDTITIPANRPIGVAQFNYFQDMRGFNLNYDFQKYVALLLKNEISVPYVDTSKVSGYFDSETSNGYVACMDNYVFLRIDLTSVAEGTFVRPDLYGKYVASDTCDVQTVGRVISLDCRFPHSGLQWVKTYYLSGMTGTETGGIPYHLYQFAFLALQVILGTTPTHDDVTDAIHLGWFGLAHIEITI